MLSGYQVELFLQAFKKKIGYQTKESHSVDALDISAEASQDAKRWSILWKKHPEWTWVRPQDILTVIGDQSVLDPLVDFEQQRRAGLFVNPPYLPSNPPPAIRLVKNYFQNIQKVAQHALAHSDPELAPPPPEPLVETSAKTSSEDTSLTIESNSPNEQELSTAQDDGLTEQDQQVER